ncbi:redoxin domain-containing protein [Hymenobacter cavernae]|uniref:Thioredoxin domain-containing protein n=1 Tax=Hymenobacter cavernae TaxID=2044852 RepID=A0ABQ1UL44_9BACT|nr:redoxin domain-containing protein [Hymenobacter cavernae]GGF20761.1 hypothetical protein GCM10011383_35560 [Hymenobacter cavernae]
MKLLLFVLVLLPGLVVGQQPFTYSLKGQLGRVPATATLYLRNNGHVLDSAHVRDGRFAFRGTSQRPQHVQLLLAPTGVLPTVFRNTKSVPADFAELFLEPTPVVLTSDNLLWHATITGGSVNKEYQLFTAQRQDLLDELYGERHPGDATRVITLASYQQERPHHLRLITKFIREHPASWVSLDLLEQRRLGPAQYDEVAPLYALLSPTLRDSAPGRAYGQLVDSLRTVAPGAAAPNLTLATATGKHVSVQDYRGQYLLLLFWSSQWEGGMQLNSLREVCNRYADLPLAVLNVSLDDQQHRKQWLRAVTDRPLPGTPASDLEGLTGRSAQRYHIDQLPQNFLLDPTGRIVAVNLYGEELAKALTKYLPPARTKLTDDGKQK